MIHRRSLLAASILAAPMLARAEASRRLTLVTGGPSGSTSDLVARSFAPFLERHLPRYRVVVENCPGEAGVTAYRHIARGPTDGTMLGWVATPALPAREVELGGPGLTDGLTLIGAVAKEPVAIVAPASGPVRTMADLLKVAEKEPVAVTRPGSPAHLTAMRLQRLTGVALELLVFPSSGAVRQATTAGNVAAGILPLGEAAPGLREEKLTPLGVASLRAEAFPDWPTLADQGIALSAWIHRGLAAPAGLSPQRLGRLSAALQAVAADPEFRAQSDGAGILTAYLAGPAWTERMATEKTEIAQLWNDHPWPVGRAAG